MALAGLVSAACAGSVVSTTPAPSPTSTSVPVSTTNPSPSAPESIVHESNASTTPKPSPTIVPAPPASGAPGTSSVTIDPSLLTLLPASVAGLPVSVVDQPAGADDPGLAETVERMAQAFVIDPVTDDFATSSVMALRPGVYSEPYFRSWRDTFDEGACSQSGGLAGHAQTTIAGRTVYVGTCSGGVTTYHVHLDAVDMIVSISAFGEHLLGEQILTGLRP